MTEDTDNLLLDRILQQRDRLEDSGTDIRDIDVLDIEYTVCHDMHVKEVSLQLCFGGPTIYLDCISGRLRGYWGGDEITRGVDSEDIGEYGSELARRFEDRVQS